MRIMTFGTTAACNTGLEDDASMRRLAAGEGDDIEVAQSSNVLRRSSTWSTPRALLRLQLQQCSIGVGSLEAAYQHRNDAAS